MTPALVGLASALTAGVGVLGGLGGAVLLVPLLVLTGTPASEAAPLGLLSVAAGSVAAAGPLLAERTVNHRLGVTTEIVATTGAVGGALAAGVLSDRALTLVLAAVAAAAAVAGGRRKGMRNRPDPSLGPADVGERVGSLAGAYPFSSTQVVPYQVRRLPVGLGFMGVAGLIAGLAGVSGGFVKTAATSEVMSVPVKVAAATTSFTIGITASAGLTVMAVQGRIRIDQAVAVIVGSIVGGQIGARAQTRLHPVAVRRVLTVLLLVVAVVLVVGG